MIFYTLVCGKGHQYKSAFNNSGTFDRLKELGELACEVCGDKRVEKGIMAPAVRTSQKTERIADLDRIEGASEAIPYVGELLPVLEAADEGDPKALSIVENSIAGILHDGQIERANEIAQNLGTGLRPTTDSEVLALVDADMGEMGKPETEPESKKRPAAKNAKAARKKPGVN